MSDYTASPTLSAIGKLASGVAQAARPNLPPLLHPLSEQLLTWQARLVEELVTGLGSPLHLMLPQVFRQTVLQFQSVLADAQVDGQVLFAKKANKSRCFIEECAALGIGVDTASVPELTQALGTGVPGSRIGVSGPAKSLQLLTLALRHACWIAIDSVQELQQLIGLAAQTGCAGRVLLRCRPDSQGQINSRFGLTDEERQQAIQLCSAHRAQITLEGFAFHLNGYSAPQRAAMADLLIDHCVAARQAGLECNTVNIGGGFAVRYVDPENWAQFLQAQTPLDFHAGRTFDGFYPYGSAIAGPAALADILATPVDEGGNLGQKFRRHGIRLLLEPGRALLDQAGITAFRVQGVKDRHAGQGYALLTVDGTSFSLSEQWFNSEYLPDPLLLGMPPDSGDPAFRACIGGSSCLDSDMLTWRKVAFPRAVEVGDILLYANTAGYQMDSNESPFHDAPLPRKVVITVDDDRAQWRLEDVPDLRPAAL